jgi:hypothetical protein
LVNSLRVGNIVQKFPAKGCRCQCIKNLNRV